MKIPPEAFEYYVRLGPCRSHRAVANHYDVTKRAVTKHATSENWSERLAEIEQKSREETDAKLVEVVGEMRERHLKTVRAIQARSLEALRQYPLANGMEAVRAAEAAIKLERLVVGEPVERSSVSVEDVTRREMDRWLLPDAPP